MKKYLLFDLDGTLTDPKVGICTCVQYALASFGIDEPNIDVLEPFIGPPLKDSFMEFYSMSEEQAEAAVEKYRERYRDIGLFENVVYDGIPELLRDLSAKGMYLAVASSKPTVFVERILEHFHIRNYFKVVVGSELDGRRVNKDEVVEEALRQLFGENPVDKKQIYMIGDRKFDIIGAHAYGLEGVGVTYGYGSMEEMREAKADYIVRSVEELRRFLMRGTEDTPKGMNTKVIWQFGMPFLFFLLMKGLMVNLMVVLFHALGGHIGGMDLFLYDEQGIVNGITGNGSAIRQIVAYIAAAGIVWKPSKHFIQKALDDEKLLHMKKEAYLNYVYLGIATLGAVLGLNLLLYLSGMVQASATYNAVASDQYAANFWLGLVLFVIVAPFAEELLFRGVIYNCLKPALKPLGAMGLSALFFGVYHGNSVQGLYGFLMGCLLVYGYEFFGDFKVPLFMHAGINLVSYLFGYTSLSSSGFVCWPVCLISVVVCAIAFWLLKRQKKIF